MFKDFLKEINPQSQINKIAKKYKNKKIIVYGAGQYSRYVVENYDLSSLNIIGFSDKAFLENVDGTFLNHKKISPYDIKNTDFDLILILAWDDYGMYKYLLDECLLDFDKRNIDVLFRPTFKQILRYFFYKH